MNSLTWSSNAASSFIVLKIFNTFVNVFTLIMITPPLTVGAVELLLTEHPLTRNHVVRPRRLELSGIA
jgi:hypothetical protein